VTTTGDGFATGDATAGKVSSLAAKACALVAAKADALVAAKAGALVAAKAGALVAASGSGVGAWLSTLSSELSTAALAANTAAKEEGAGATGGNKDTAGFERSSPMGNADRKRTARDFWGGVTARA